MKKQKAKNLFPLKAISYKLKANNGFTLIEVLLSIALIALVVGLSLPVYGSFQARNNLDIAANTVVHSLRRAEIKSLAVEEDSRWGVRIEEKKVIIFKGDSFVGRNPDFDEAIDFSPGIQSSNEGLKEITFSKLSGSPSTSGTIILKSSTEEKREIRINEKATISY